MEPGYLSGEICNRNGCEGVIAEHEKEGSCSCHINPPCSYCTTDTAYCPVCGWEPAEDIKPIDPEVEKRNQEYYQKQQEEWKAAEEAFDRKYNGKEPVTELEIRSQGHTHFTMLKMGVFPAGTQTRESIEQIVKGSFGGRFTKFEETRFEYIAYTD